MGSWQGMVLTACLASLAAALPLWTLGQSTYQALRHRQASLFLQGTVLILLQWAAAAGCYWLMLLTLN